MLKRFGPLPRFLLSMAGLLVLLAVTAGLWWWLPPWPARAWASDSVCRTIFISANGKVLVTENALEVVLWDAVTGDKLGMLDRQPTRAALRNPAGGPPGSTSLSDTTRSPNFPGCWLSPDGRTFVFHESEGSSMAILLWSGGFTAPQIIPGAIDVAAITLDSQTLIAYTLKGLAFIDLATGKELPSPLEGNGIHAARLNTGEVRAVTSDGQSLTVWSLNPMTKQRTIPATGNHQVALSGNGKVLAAWDSKEVKIWDLAADRLRCVVAYPAHERPLHDLVDLNADGSRMLLHIRRTPGPDPNLVVDGLPEIEAWDVETSTIRLLRKFPAARGVRFCPDGRAVLCQDLSWGGMGPPQGNAELWDAAILKQPLVLTDARTDAASLMGRWCAEMDFAPDSRTVAGLCINDHVLPPSLLDRMLKRPVLPIQQSITLWDVATGQELGSIRDRTAFAYFPDGQSLAVWLPNRINDLGTIEIWDLPPRRPWWIDYGLPVVFALLVLLGVRLVWRAFRKPAEVTPC